MGRDLSRLTSADLDTLIDACATAFRCPLFEAVADDLGDLADYPDRWGASFWPEFSGFALDYLHYRRFMVAHGLHRPVIDLGCSHGFASSLFLNDGYLGIDQQLMANINAAHPKVEYQQADARDIPLSGKLVISNMSLGFFGKGPLGGMTSMLDSLASADTLMMAAPMPLIEALLPAFPYQTRLPHSAPAEDPLSCLASGKRIALPTQRIGRVILHRK